MSGENQELTDKLIDFYRNYYRDDVGMLAQNYPNEQRSLYIDYDDLYRFDRDMADDWQDNPEQMQEYAEEALRLYDLPADVKLSNAHVRLTNIERNVGIRNIRVHDDHIGKMISVSGIVRKATDVRPKITEACFECQRCGTFSYIPQSDGDFQEPHECQGCERQGPFRVNFDNSEFIDAQKIRVQESPEGLRGGETPQSIDVNLEDDICGEVTAGDHVTVTGVLHIEQQTSGKEKSALFDLYMDGVSVAIADEDMEDMDISHEDEEMIQEISERPNLYEDMVASFAPAIYGYDEEKLAMILQLFSGVTKHLPDGTRIRGDLHILNIGDPGTGKSQLISYVENIAPRSVYTSGKGSSSAGLTAAAVRDDFGDGNQWTLEAGAMVLADKGIVGVDELDKMDASDRSAMHEGLEQQKISVSKAGINATLKSRCSLLGAANPKHGRFDQYEPIGEQIDIEPALISRFDLIFTFTDTPDPEYDDRLADHILETNIAGGMHEQQKNLPDSPFGQDEVKEKTDEVDPEIDSENLRKYVAYAKSNCYPVPNQEAKERLKEFYVKMRSKASNEDDPVPVTARKLEALVRLTEASARVRLSNEATIEDAERCIQLVTRSLDDVGKDPETGEYDADVVETGTTKTQRDRIKTVKGVIETLQPSHGGVEMDEIIETASHEGHDKETVEKEVEKLRRKGELYEPSTNEYRLS